MLKEGVQLPNRCLLKRNVTWMKRNVVPWLPNCESEVGFTALKVEVNVITSSSQTDARNTLRPVWIKQTGLDTELSKNLTSNQNQNLS